MKKIFSILIVIVFFTSCNFYSPKFIKCTQQEWSIKSKNISGTVCHLVLKSKTDSSKLKIDSIGIFNKLITDFKYSVLGKSNTTKKFYKGDSILISFNITSNNKYNYFDENNCVFIHLGNKNKRVKIQSILKLPDIIND